MTGEEDKEKNVNNELIEDIRYAGLLKEWDSKGR